MLEQVTIQDGAHFRAAERETEVPRLRALHRIHGKPARFVCRARKRFEIQGHGCLYGGAGMWQGFSAERVVDECR
jgi:hypothetical protein